MLFVQRSTSVEQESHVLRRLLREEHRGYFLSIVSTITRISRVWIRWTHDERFEGRTHGFASFVCGEAIEIDWRKNIR